MEEKKFPKSHSSFWPVFSFGRYQQSFLGKFHSAKSHYSSRVLNSNAGLTLVELLVVVAILGVLATVLIAAIDPLGQIRKSYDAQRKSDLRQIQSALEIYRSDNGGYPPAPLTCGASLTSGGSTYMKKIPCDPKGTNVSYTYTSGGTTTYILIACLENVKDSQRDLPTNDPHCTGGTTNWSYTLTNP